MTTRKIEDIYADYFQKSKVFLFPALGIKRGTSVTPIETYMLWGDKIKITDRKLVCLYYLRDDSEFISYEEKFLLQNPLFEDYQEVGNDKAIYIFNFDKYADDFDKVAQAKYSEISEELKKKIKDVYGAGSANYMYIKSYLYPEQHWETYAEILCPCPDDREEMYNILKEVRELCSKPDMKREKLKKISTKSLKL